VTSHNAHHDPSFGYCVGIHVQKDLSLAWQHTVVYFRHIENRISISLAFIHDLVTVQFCVKEARCVLLRLESD
jgi:hypothetical protein